MPELVIKYDLFVYPSSSTWKLGVPRRSYDHKRRPRRRLSLATPNLTSSFVDLSVRVVCFSFVGFQSGDRERVLRGEILKFDTKTLFVACVQSADTLLHAANGQPYRCPNGIKARLIDVYAFQRL